MSTLAAISSAAVLSLDGAAALLRARVPACPWTVVPAAGPATDPLDPPGGVRWLFADAPPPRRAGREVVTSLRERLVTSGEVFGCVCSPVRLRDLVATALAQGVRPTYDGHCATASTGGAGPARAATVRLRLRHGRDGVGGHPVPAGAPVDAAIALLAIVVEHDVTRLTIEPSVARTARVAAALAAALGRKPPRIEVGPTVVGPDGAPLWRAGAATVASLEAEGYEPAGVRRFLTRSRHLWAIPFDRAALDAANQAAIGETDPRDLVRRLMRLLADLDIEADGARARRLLEAVRPRLTRFERARSLLAFLRPEIAVPAFDAADARQIRRIGEALLADPPASGSALQDHLVALAGDAPDEVHDFRRVLRWAITGQEVAPPVAEVWELLGADTATERLGAAVRSVAEG